MPEQDFDIEKVRKMVDPRSGRPLTEEQISLAVSKMNKILINENIPKIVYEEKVFIRHGMTPCGDCGGTDFRRTGTCHVCLTCGSSQGCS